MTLDQIKKLQPGDHVEFTQIFLVDHVEVLSDRVKLGFGPGQGLEFPFDVCNGKDMPWINPIGRPKTYDIDD
jgi:hypothetical protein